MAGHHNDANSDQMATGATLRRAYLSLNYDGNSRDAVTRSGYTAWRASMFFYSDGSLRRTPRDLAAEALASGWRDGDLGINDLIASVLVHQFNLSFALPQNATSAQIKAAPRVILCVSCGLGNYQHTQMTLIMLNDYVHLYCTRKATLQRASLIFFLRPFDLWTWGCLADLTLLLAAGLLAFDVSAAAAGPQQVWYALDILWTLIWIPRQNRAWPGPIALLFSVFFFASQGYIAFFTSDVLAPLQPARIRTNKELFDQGFRVVNDHGAYAPANVQNFTRNRIQFTADSFMKASTPEPCRAPGWDDWALCVAAWPDEGTRRTLTKLAARSIRQILTVYQGSEPGLFCATVDEMWDHSVWLTFQVMGHLQSVIARAMARFTAAGIFPGYWDGLKMAEAGREFPVTDPRFVPRRLSFNTALLSVI